MNYKQAKTKAQLAADASGLDYVTIGSNNNFDIAIAKRHKGEFVDYILPVKAEEIAEQEAPEKVIEKPKRNVPKKG